MSRACETLDSLNPNNYAAADDRKYVAGDDRKYVGAVAAKENYSLAKKHWGHYLIFFIVIVLLVYVILALLPSPPLALQSRDINGQYTGRLDNGKAFGTAIIIGIIAVIIYYLIRRA